ncbi:MAG: glycosyltransferase family 2 protein [Planctomycetota bacterium]|nr:glycosyltransferase family 2 protein [Planctomycetota bacterium]MDA1141223.1 glycosyltransferase family 2 protein [Planctomycetota bacterium]
MKLSIVIPVYNEKETIGALCQKVLDVDIGDIQKEIILVDDGSTDGTRELLDEFDSGLYTIIKHEVNQGKGGALQTGFEACTGDIVIVQDADLEYDPSEFPRLLAPILKGNADVVYGSRFVGHDAHRVLFFWHYQANQFLTLLSNMMTNLNLTDMECCYKVFRSEVLKQLNLKEKRFGIEPEMTAKVARLNVRIYEVGISYYGRTYDEGKKIGWKDGVRALYCILKYRFFS